MANINVELTVELQCPNVLAFDSTDYTDLDGGNHGESEMEFTYLKLWKFGEVDKYHEYYSPDSSLVAKPSLLNFEYMTGIDGIYKVSVVFLPKENYGTSYEKGDCIYHTPDAKVYKFVGDNPANLVDEASLETSDWLDLGVYNEVDFDEVTDKYKSEDSLSVRCHLFPCVKKQVHKAKCLVEKYGNNNYLYCKDPEFVKAVKMMTLFYELYYGVTKVNNDNEVHLAKIFSLANSLCCK